VGTAETADAVSGRGFTAITYRRGDESRPLHDGRLPGIVAYTDANSSLVGVIRPTRPTHSSPSILPSPSWFGVMGVRLIRSRAIVSMRKRTAGSGQQEVPGAMFQVPRLRQEASAIVCIRRERSVARTWKLNLELGKSYLGRGDA